MFARAARRFSQAARRRTSWSRRAPDWARIRMPAPCRPWICP